MTTNTLTSLLTEDIDAVLENARRNSLTRDNPALADLPAWWQSFRDHQRIAIREILCAYEEGAECVVLDAPTGAGKTLIAETVRRLIPDSRQTTYVCSSKSLQDQFCVVPETRILTADLKYKAAGDLVVGEELLGFDEERTPNRRFWRRSVVEAIEYIIQPCYELTTIDGTKVTCSADHQWLTNPEQVVKWTPTERLRVSSGGHNSTKLCRVLDVWDQDTSWAAGYLAAAFDGEGHLHQADAPRGKGYDVNLSFAQNENEMLTLVRKLLDEKGYLYKLHLGNGDKCYRLTISGRRETLRFLGEIRPARLMGKLNLDKLGMMNPARPCALVGKRYVGHKTVVAIKTSTGTYVAEGLASHNCSDYPYAKVLKGRSNYATERYPERFGGRDPLTCADCTKSPGDPESCLWCTTTNACPYEGAKCAALRSELAVLNTSYFLSECNGPGRFSRGGLVIADEADTLESELMSHVEVRISERRLKQYGLGVPKYVTKEESWKEWAKQAVDAVRFNPPKLSSGLDEVQRVRARKRHEILFDKLRTLHAGLEEGGWVYTGTKTDVAFKPVTVSSLGQDKLWQHGDKWLLMSATVISADELLESLGWDDGKDWRLVRVPSTFKPENRKVVIWPVASMTYKTKEESEPKVVDAVREVVNRHPDERILVHSTSYRLTNRIVEGLTSLPAGAGAAAPSYPPVDRSVFTYTSSQEKEGALASYLSYPNAVLVAPSLDRGIDLPGDLCRVQIICKVPFLSLSDKQVSARLYGTGLSGRTWYAVNAIRTIVQMTGRATRSEDDWCVNYILDKQFIDNIWSSHKRLIPNWWRESLVWATKGLK